jgi:DNA processing protein
VNRICNGLRSGAGIDTAAHLGVLETGAIVVMAGRVDILHPAENANLGQDLTTKGLRISEHPMNIAPKAHHFPSRNRLVSGICSGVIIVEATAKSGRLFSALDALDQ